MLFENYYAIILKENMIFMIRPEDFLIVKRLHLIEEAYLIAFLASATCIKLSICNSLID